MAREVDGKMQQILDAYQKRFQLERHGVGPLKGKGEVLNAPDSPNFDPNKYTITVDPDGYERVWSENDVDIYMRDNFPGYHQDKGFGLDRAVPKELMQWPEEYQREQDKPENIYEGIMREIYDPNWDRDNFVGY